MERLKVAVDATILESKGAGLDRYTREVLTQLSCQMDNNIMNVSVFASNDSLKVQWDGEIRSVPQLTSPSLGFRGNLFRLLWHTFVLPLVLWRKKFNVFFSPISEGPIIPIVRQIITVHDLLPIKFPEVYPKIKFYFKYVLPLVLRASSAIIVVSESTKHDLIETYKVPDKSVHVIYGGINHSVFRPLSLNEIDMVRRKYNLQRYILCLGETRPYKNLDRLIQAYAKLNLTDIDLVVVGSIKQLGKEQLLERPLKLGIQDRVKFLGYVPDDDLPGLYGGAFVFAFPSLYEGFGLPPLEAMACGCPVVVSKTSSLPEVCADAAYYVDPYDVDNIAKGINEVITNAELRESLRQKGMSRVKTFSWNKTVNDILKIIRSVGYKEC